MSFPKLAKTGLLLFMTVGPLLVFLFLYIFGENKFELDRYPFKGLFLIEQPSKKASLVLPDLSNIHPGKTGDLRNEIIRLEQFFKKMDAKPEFIEMSNSESSFKAFGLRSYLPFDSKPMMPVPSFMNMQFSDTVFVIESAEGIHEKRLPTPPRAFLFDSERNLRGVYGLTNSLSVDTLMLEYKILTNQ